MAQVESGKWTGWTTAGIDSIDLGRNNLIGSTVDFTKPTRQPMNCAGHLSIKLSKMLPERECWVRMQPGDKSVIEVNTDGRVYLMDGYGGELAHTEPLALGEWQFIEFDQRNFTITVTPGMGPR